MKLILLIICILELSSCKSDRIAYTDCNYIYVWKYSINGDSVLYKYNQPRIIERKIIGGRYKHKKLKVDVNNDGNYRSVRVPYGMDRSEIVRKAKQATRRNPLIGVFREEFYPYHHLEFIRYK